MLKASAAIPLRVLAVLLLVAGLAAAECVWTGNGPDAKWTTALNWQSGQRPAAGDAVIFPAGAVQGCVINVPVTVRTLTLAGDFTHTVDAGGRALSISEDLVVAGGELVGASQLTVWGDLSLTGGSLICTALSLAGDLSDSAGTLAVSGRTRANTAGALWTFAPGSHLGDLEVVEGSLTVDGLVANGGVTITYGGLEAVGGIFRAGSLIVDASSVRIAADAADIGTLFVLDTMEHLALPPEAARANSLAPPYDLRLESPATTLESYASTAGSTLFQGDVTITDTLSIYESVLVAAANLELRGDASLSYDAQLRIQSGGRVYATGRFALDASTARLDIVAGGVVDVSAARPFANQGSVVADGSLLYPAAGLGFTTAAGLPVASITPGEAIYLTLIDQSANVDGTAPDTVVVTVSTPGGDLEVVSLVETANASGIFINALPFSSSAAPATTMNQTLEFAIGMDIEALYQDAHDGGDQLAISLAGVSPQVVWTGWDLDGQWANPDNWSPARVPTVFDTAVFNELAWGDCFFATDIAVRHLRLEAGFAHRLRGYQEDGYSRLTIHGDALIEDGILDIGTLAVAGDLLQSAGDLRVVDELWHPAGSAAATWSFLPTAAIHQIRNLADLDIATAPAPGTMVVNQDGSLALRDGAWSDLSSSGTMTVTAAVGIREMAISGVLTIEGALRVADGFSNSGIIALSDGALLDLSTCASVSNAGQIILADAAQVRRFASELAFDDGMGGTATGVVVGQAVNVRLLDDSINLNGPIGETVEVVLRSPASGDQETVVLLEDEQYPGVFRGTIGSAAGSAVHGDGTLQMIVGENLVLSYADPYDSEDRLTTMLNEAQGVEIALSSSASQTTGLDPIPVQVHAAEAIVGLIAADFVISNGSVGSFTGSGQDYLLLVHSAGDGLVSVWLPPGVAASADGSRSTRGATLVRTVDTQAPTVSIALALGQAATTTVAPIVFAVSFDEPVTGFDAADVAVAGGIGGSVSVSGSGASYLVSVSGFSGPGVVSIGISAGAASDAAGNPSQAAAGSPSVVFQAVSLAIGRHTVSYVGAAQGVAIGDPLDANASVTITYQAWSDDPDLGGSAIGAVSTEAPFGAGWYRVVATLGGSQLGGGSSVLRIVPVPLVVTVDSQVRLVGAPDPVFTGSVLGAIVGDGVTVTYGTTADAASPAGSYPITASVSALPGRLASYEVVVVPGVLLVQAAGVAPVITSPATAAGVRGESFAYQITASGGPVTFAASGLPAGLSVDGGTGAVSGIPTASGTFAVTVTASNANGTGERVLSLVVVEPGAVPSISSSASAAGTRGLPFAYQITASGSPTAFGASGLPVGLTVDPVTGLISGIPSLSGAATASIMASNAHGSAIQVLALAIAEPVGPAVSFLAPRQSLFPGQAVQLTVATGAPVATDLPVLVKVATAIAGMPTSRLVTIPAGAAQATATLPVVPIGTAAGATVTCDLSGVVEGDEHHLVATVVGAVGDAEPLHVRSADGLADGASVIGPQDINLQAVDGVPPYAVVVSGAAAVVRPWQVMAAAYDLDGDGDPDLGQQFTILPRGTGTLIITLTDAASASATFSVTVLAGEPASVIWSVPVSAPTATTYAAIGVSGFGGADYLLQLTAGGDRASRRGFIHSPIEGRWYELPDMPAGGALPWDGCYLASRLAVAGGTAARAMGSLPYIPLYPGWNFITVPPFLADSADPGSVVTTVPIADLALFDESGAPLSRAARDALFAAAPIRTWDGSAFVTVTSVEAARGYFVANSSTAPVRMLYLAPVLGYGAATGGPAALRAARPLAASGKGQAALTGAGVAVATRPVGDPPAPPSSTAQPAAAESGGGCGIGSLGLILGFGLVWLSGLAGLRRRR